MHQSGWFCSRFSTMHCGRGTHVCPAESVEIKNTVCSQTSTCLTCWPWCYRAQPCHTVTSVTHGSLSSLPQQPTLLPLTHWHKFCLTARLPSFCLLSTLSLVLHILYCCLSSRASVFFSTLCNILSHFCSLSPRSLSLSILHIFSQTYPRWAAGGQQAMTVVLAVNCEVTFRSAPLRLYSTVWATETKREEDEGAVNGKYWKTARWETGICMEEREG